SRRMDMAVIRLPAERTGSGDQSIRILDEDGREQIIPLLRLRVSISVGRERGPRAGPDRPKYNALIDTGSPLTVIPKHTWQEFASEVIRRPLVGTRAPVGRAGGRQFTSFLGRIWVSAPDAFGRRLPAVPVLAQSREDDIPAGERLPPILLGLHGGIL